MDENEQLYSSEEYAGKQQPIDQEEFDYNREPPLDSATASSNKRNSKYVFMTLCFLLALLLFYNYITHLDSGDSTNWFPLIGGIVLSIMGVIFLRSPDNPPVTPSLHQEDEQAEQESISQAADKPLDAFEKLVHEAIATIPEHFHAQMENVLVHVEYEPSQETLTRVGVKEGHILLGLYEGVPLTTYGRSYAPYPEMITIFQRSIEEYCHHDSTRIREQFRSTVLHEIAHHFGMGHEEMPIWIK